MYRKMETLISYSAYEKLWAAGVLDMDICQLLPEGWQEPEETETGRKKKKRVPVYILEFKTGVAVASAAIISKSIHLTPIPHEAPGVWGAKK